MTSIAYDRLCKLVDQHGARFLDLKLVDLLGRLRHLSLPTAALGPSVFSAGTGFDGSSYGFKKVHASDMLMIPDVETAALDPFRAERTLSMMASIHLAEEGLPRSEQDSRGVLERALALVRGLGVADEALFALEYEFYIFKALDLDFGPAAAAWRIHSEEAEETNLYHAANPVDRYDDFRDEAVGLLVEMGMPIRYHHHEGGGFGQQEIEFDLEDAMAAADHAVQVRYVLANLAERHGLRVTFMPKPLFNQPGSGFHAHQMLRAKGQNLFHDPKGLHGLSTTALHWIAGILTHAPALTAFTNASTNSYKRLCSGFEAPNAITFGPANRMASIRIPRWATGSDTRIEYRPGDFTGNPYLAIAAMVLAGLDGLRRGLDPVSAGFGPAEALDPASIRTLPSSLEAALEALRVDHAFLTETGAFSDNLVEQWIQVKKRECEAVGQRPHPHEFKLYF